MQNGLHVLLYFFVIGRYFYTANLYSCLICDWFIIEWILFGFSFEIYVECV